METVTWTSIKNILKDHRGDFKRIHAGKIRENTYTTIQKVLDCWENLGYMSLSCSCCMKIKQIHFTCKSRFCNTCSKPASDKRLSKLISWRPAGLHYNHFIFTMPEQLSKFFLRNRKALHLLPKVSTQSILYFYKKKYNCTPWIVSVIHTFGAKLNRNTHTHVMLSAGWITPYGTYKSVWFVPYLWMLASWKWYLLKACVERVKQNRTWKEQHEELRILQAISTVKKNNELKSWYIHFSKKADNFQQVLGYIWRYLKRPVIAQSRILSYDNHITFEYIDKYDWERKTITMEPIEFIGQLVQHIPNKRFKMITYSWMFAPRVKKKYLFILNRFFQQKVVMKIINTYRWRVYQSTGIDIARCECWGVFKKRSICIPWYQIKIFNTS